MARRMRRSASKWWEGEASRCGVGQGVGTDGLVNDSEHESVAEYGWEDEA
jgi:hypothetical protein